MQQPVLDLAYLRSITEGTRALEEEFFRLFYQTADRCTARLAASVTAQNDTEWEEASHELKGAASYLGARRVQEICTQARDAEKSERERLLATLNEALEDLSACVSELRYAS